MEVPKSDNMVRFRTFKVLKGERAISKIICAVSPLFSPTKEYHVGLSFCSPEDFLSREEFIDVYGREPSSNPKKKDRFTKARGRKKAIGRLQKAVSGIKGLEYPKRITINKVDSLKDALRDTIVGDAIEREIKWMSEILCLNNEDIKNAIV